MYTAEQIDSGAFGMQFHPVTGDWKALLMYDQDEQRYYKMVTGGLAWGVTPANRREYLARIGDGQPREEDALLSHAHWRFDPFTGRRIESRVLNTAWNLD